MACCLSAETLRTLLNYDPETGIFTWRSEHGNWRIGQVAGYPDRNGTYRYRRIHLCGRIYRAHRLAWLWMTGDWPPDGIDHRNLNPKDNRWANLRAADQSQNMANQKPRAACGFKGVKQNGRRWHARIRKDYRYISLGSFATAEEAYAAYREAATRLFGEFARVA